MKNGQALGMVLAWIALTLAAPPAMAQSSSAAVRGEAARAIRELEARIADLERQLSEIKTTLSGVEPRPPGDVSEGIHPTAFDAMVAPESPEPADDHSDVEGEAKLRLRGYSDINFGIERQGQTRNSFAVGQINLFMTSRLSKNMSVLGELVFEAGEDNSLDADFERLLLQYSHGDRFKIGVGRYHSAIGYYNTAYHHGLWFQTAMGRPRIFEFEDEGGILPVHNVGVSISGRVPSGWLNLGYLTEVGNGRASHSRDAEAVQLVRDENGGKSLNLGLRVNPSRLEGFQAGFSLYRDRLTPDGRPHVNQQIAAAHVVYDGGPWELLAEGVRVRHAQHATGLTADTFSSYAQGSRRFGLNQPYVRYEYLRSPESDPVFDQTGRTKSVSAGLKRTLNEFSTLKGQYRWQRQTVGGVSHGLAAQLAFTF